MAFQKEKAALAPQAFDGMRFDMRIKQSDDSALAKQVLVAQESNAPIGCAFSAIGDIPERARCDRPDWLELPQKSAD